MCLRCFSRRALFISSVRPRFCHVMKIDKRFMRRMHPQLKILNGLSPKEYTYMLRSLSPEACDGLCECVRNGLTNPTLSEQDQIQLHQELAPLKRKFRRLLAESNPAKKKRALIRLGAGTRLILEKVFPLLEEYLSLKNERE